MPLLQNDFQRIAIHESSHVAIGINRGFQIYGMMMDGPPDNPGAVWRVLPDGQSPEVSREWALKSLDLFCAGYIGEELFYGNDAYDERFVEGASGDFAMIDYFAFQNLFTKEEERIAATKFQANGNIPYDRWRVELSELPWAKYDELIQSREDNVRSFLQANKADVAQLAAKLLAENYVRGRDIYQILKKPWNGISRTAGWAEIQ
jgi:ATP-dependent Zn protease